MKSVINIPYSELLTLEDKKKLETQLKDVEIIDIDKSMQAYISAQLTDSEMRTFQKLEDDYSARGKINRLVQEFNELETIPKEFQVKDITQTPLAKSLIRIQELIQNYQELALIDTDTSQKSHEYFTNITNELKTFDNETQLQLIEKMLPEINTAVWRHSKFNPKENPEQYKKRWKELKNSLKARITGYKDELRITDNSNGGFTVMQWAIILYYVDAEKYSHIVHATEKVRQLIKDFGLSYSYDNLYNTYMKFKSRVENTRSDDCEKYIKEKKAITPTIIQDMETVLLKIKKISKEAFSYAKDDISEFKDTLEKNE